MRTQTSASGGSIERKIVSVRGVVQGVGFRPFVYRLAHEHDLTGWVLNHSGGVEIEVEGSSPSLAAFMRGLQENPPPLARIESVEVTDGSPIGYETFEIRHSVAEPGRYQLISPDSATCPDCLRELMDPGDRRYRYPFTNCTNCGPRFTIIADIPYDRPLTTMREFTMCPQCQAEYDDPLDRRFHAQPNACPICGPHVWLTDATGNPLVSDETGVDNASADVLARARDLLLEGKILAIKGLGGFHLACDATNAEAVRTLRERKDRPAKPLAVMMSTLEEVEKHCRVSEEEERLLTSSQCPIVLLRWESRSNVARLVAPRNRFLGVMLPYTPLHHVLLRDVDRPLVMTSGNLSEEPIARDNDEALRRLGHLADYFLLHNRDIYARYDDSVWFVLLRGETGFFPKNPVSLAQPIRRSRGYAPFPVKMPFEIKQILACGAELKNTFCVTRDEYAFISQHIGDMENLETLEHFETTIELYKRLFRIEPEIVAYDMHPEYLATKYAKSQTPDHVTRIAVQHHYAHIASCLADNGWSPDAGPVIGIAWDGTGYGIDGRIWGGEFLVTDYRGFRRVAHLEYMPIPGGEAAIRNPYRLAIGYLYALTGQLPSDLSLSLSVDAADADRHRSVADIANVDRAFVRSSVRASGSMSAGPGEEELRIIRQQVDRGINCPQTSAGGRLFDAVSALLGVRGRVTYEAQAAVELEMAAHRWLLERRGDVDRLRSRDFSYPFGIEEGGDGVEGDGVRVIRLRGLFEALLADLQDGVSVGEISYRFHVTVAEMMRVTCERIAQETGLRTVALSGGCFQNRLLLALVVPKLREAGLHVLTHRQVPCNDGGISLGQAVIAHFAVENSLDVD